MFLAGRLYQQLKKHSLIRPEQIRRSMTRLYKGNALQTEERVDAYYTDLLNKIIWILLISGSLSVLIWGIYQKQDKGQLHFSRDDYGGDEVQYVVSYEDQEKKLNQFTITLEPVQYRPEELTKQFQEGFFYLENVMLGDNESLDNIQVDMKLETSIPDSGLKVSWSSDAYEIMDERGMVNNQNLPEAQIVRLQLELSYEEIAESREYEVVVQPKQLTGVEEEQRRLQKSVEALVQDARYEQEVVIPSDIQGVHLIEEGNQDSIPGMILILGMVFGSMLWFRQKEQLQLQLKQQNRELLREYPCLVNQLVLYLEAGATIKGAFERILHQYEMAEKKEHPLYEELMVMWNEMHSGVTQEQAYMNLGKRIGLLPYLKLTSLLTQQIRKGAAGVIPLLEEEEHEAFERRKEQAKRMGEEAGTKLLVPMIILMVISMLIVVCPAVMSFAI